MRDKVTAPPVPPAHRRPPEAQAEKLQPLTGLESGPRDPQQPSRQGLRRSWQAASVAGTAPEERGQGRAGV